MLSLGPVASKTPAKQDRPGILTGSALMNGLGSLYQDYGTCLCLYVKFKIPHQL